jgi:hypothetical protein
MLSKEENVFEIYVLDCGFDSRNPGGFLTKFPAKGYPAIWTIRSDPNDPD